MRYYYFFKQKTGSLSNAYWLLPFIMVFRGTFLIRTRPGSEYASIGVYGAVNIVTTVIIIFVLLSKWHHVVATLRDSGAEIKFIIAYYSFCVLSGMWSINMAYSSYQGIEFLANFMIVLLLMHNIGDFFKAERFMLLAGFVITIMVIVGLIIYAGWGSYGTNTSVVIAGVLLAYAFAELATATGKRKKLLMLSSILGFVVLALVGSTGSNISIVLAISLLLVLSTSHWKYIILVLSGCLLIPNLHNIEQYLFPGTSFEGIANLEHRAGVWESSWELYLQRPLLGYGFGGVATKYHMSLLSSHNNILEILLDCGIAGATIMLGAYITLFTGMFRGFIKHKRGAAGCFIALIFFFINNLSIPVFGTKWITANTFFTMLLGLFTYYVAPRKRVMY